MDSLTFYTNPMSRGRIVRWMLEELGQPYETVVLAYGPAMKAADYLAVNPMGKVPAVVHDGRVVTECAAICCYLADAFPQAGLMPENRAAFYRWMFFAAGPLEQAVVNASFGWKPGTVQEAGRTGYGSLETAVGAISDHVAAQEFVAGEAFSAADVYVGSQIGWGLQFGTIPRTEALSAYWDRIKTRPAAARATTLDDALISKDTRE
ncbi:glutathione S-transferase family protein [Pseudotabrizicola alkalilacus]|uniref:Glutathione S-transferase family protein n=1 Tax=Pseudotabrizicola alkalilacus TaxID=2305252 RepID=A0A411Z648_9RHOB|nr:glutathione S-transferase family protein [Pseudotabrizicola alkalilacus]RGP38524.1 glutathione S-transferase family protein [Pseudotabrizicola alkalilacus]